ncbi:hypothetical protein DDB_G0285485 [Dictyostelium discoideum AX4]|uniref:G domain-containing protein n=1 Tax=Dictyostelium discoideum TaxID=44689 RepID=Q54N59_DICDI|nr:hypothetical protein DDB_G0285485 [Dictyostelium discoideum AX4]EAL64580.1 hypothetical protein DDB_G0285485 [Dictyostelium discoideum AX4]|eukprot:XP_638084.1 hypothetical protein DDB_G0285485 [Dictyostelium discoideum AX4]
MDLDYAIIVLRHHLESNGRFFEISKDDVKNRVTIKNKLTQEERYIDFGEIQNFIQYDEFEYNLLANGFQENLSILKNSILPLTKAPDSCSSNRGKTIGNSSLLINKVNGLIDDDKDTIYLLLIGITGVGKSTFVNMVVNYIEYSNLKDALENATLEQIYTIASKIEIQDENKTHKFSLGDVEDYKIGSSVTQYSRQYRIKLPDGKTLCLIDAPGVGDPQGTLQDNKHFENILHEISSLKKLNAICILMRPDETRATVLFKYCLNQLLLHLHSSAKDNIFFCFTHTRGTMYKPGPTRAILEDHLKKMKDQSDIEINANEKTFCFDNESFNYLAVKKYNATAGIETNFSEDDEFDFGRSWDRSSKEFKRLLEEISKVQPHDVANTICINNARTMISNLAQPMSTCISNINTNIKLMEQQSEKLRNNSIGDESLLYIPVSVVIAEKLENSLLVCTKNGCSSNTDNPCNIDVVSPKWYSSLYWCDNINKMGTCKKCSNTGVLPCLWFDHQVVTIKETPQLNQLPGTDKKTIGQRTKSEIFNERELLVTKMGERKIQFQEEYDTIKTAIVDFSVFLWHHSLIKFNRYYEDYINMQIKQLENSENSQELIQKLNEHLSEYKASVEEIKHNVQNNKASVKTQKEIFATFDKLLTLPNVGYIIQNQIKLKQSSHYKSEAVEIDLFSKMKNKTKQIIK